MQVDFGRQRVRRVVEYCSRCVMDEIWSREAVRRTGMDDRRVGAG